MAAKNNIITEQNLLITQNSKQLLSKNQITFNKLTAEIAAEKLLLEKHKIHLDHLNIHYHKVYTPTNIDFYNNLLVYVKNIYNATQVIKVTKNQIELLRQWLIDKLEECFDIVKPSEEYLTIYKSLTGDAFDNNDDFEYDDDNESANIENEADDEFEFFLENLEMHEIFNAFKSGVDFDELKNNKEQQEAFKNKILEDRLKEEKQEKREKEKQEKKKSKKQKEREAKEKEAALIELKSLKSIYLSLVKLLHPDLETDEFAKSQKEETLKRVTVAYKAKDLTTLLKLEMEWINDSTNNLENLSEEKLAMYCNVLKKQKHELVLEKYHLKNDPRYASVYLFANLGTKKAVDLINKDCNSLKFKISELQEDCTILQDAKQAKKAKAILKEIYNHQKVREEEDEFDLGFDWF